MLEPAFPGMAHHACLSAVFLGSGCCSRQPALRGHACACGTRHSAQGRAQPEGVTSPGAGARPPGAPRPRSRAGCAAPHTRSQTSSQRPGAAARPRRSCSPRLRTRALSHRRCTRDAPSTPATLQQRCRSGPRREEHQAHQPHRWSCAAARRGLSRGCRRRSAGSRFLFAESPVPACQCEPVARCATHL
jgi:hypothetical protein